MPVNKKSYLYGMQIETPDGLPRAPEYVIVDGSKAIAVTLNDDGETIEYKLSKRSIRRLIIENKERYVRLYSVEPGKPFVSKTDRELMNEIEALSNYEDLKLSVDLHGGSLLEKSGICKYKPA